MSAYMVDNATVTAMVTVGLGQTEPSLIGNAASTPLTWWTGSIQRVREQLQGGDRYDQFRRKLGFANATEVGIMLLAENVRSLEARYPDSADEWAKLREVIADYTYPTEAWVYRLTLGDVVGCIGCYEYQACESGDWEDTEAWSFCHNLRHRLLEHAAKDQPWGLDQAELDARRTGARNLSAIFYR